MYGEGQEMPVGERVNMMKTPFVLQVIYFLASGRHIQASH